MKKYSLKLNSNDQHLLLPVVKAGNLLGYDDDVTSLVTDETNSSINNEIDGEVRRILPSTDDKIIQFNFWDGSNYIVAVAPLEFTNPAVDINTKAAKNSFYVVQLYNSFKDEIQSKKHTGYFNGYDFTSTNLISVYSFSSSVEFSNFYVSQSVLDSMSGITTDFYIKFLFYCAKSGNIYSFYNNNAPSTTQEKLYHKISINPNTLRYTFNPDISIIQLNELLNSNYNTFINNTVNSIPVEKPNYPSGNTFTNEGDYITV